MTTDLPTTLGIDVGGRQIGVAVFRGLEIVFHAVKTIKGENDGLTLANTRRIVGGLARDFRITSAALQRIVFVQQHRAFKKVVYEEAVTFLKELNIPYAEHDPRTVRSAICRGEKPTKANCARVLAGIYPELARPFSGPKGWQKRYYSLLLNAVAVGRLSATRFAPEIRGASDRSGPPNAHERS